MTACEHSYSHKGVVYETGDRPFSGTSARPVRYYDAYFCTRCLDMRYERLTGEYDSYGQIRFGATPKAVQP
jgi:hypothetical protein